MAWVMVYKENTQGRMNRAWYDTTGCKNMFLCRHDALSQSLSWGRGWQWVTLVVGSDSIFNLFKHIVDGLFDRLVKEEGKERHDLQVM